MSEKDFNNLMELAQQQLQEKVSKEEALRSLIRCGLLDKDGHLVVPELHHLLTTSGPSSR